MDGFVEGYNYFANNSGGFAAGALGQEYFNSISQSIKDLTDNINHFEGYNTPIDKLKGNVAEYWHAGTYNIKAAVNGSTNRASVLGSNEYGSVDVGTSWGENYGLKYNKTGAESAKQQAKSVFEKYNEFTARGGKDSFEKYCQDRGYSDESILHDPVYSGQMRLIPSDQFKDASEWLENKIKIELKTRPEQAKRYQETLKFLRSKIKDNDGNESIELSLEDSKKLAKMAEDGDFDPQKWGLTTEELISFKNIMQQAAKAGITSAVISMVLKTAPEIMNAINHLIESGDISIEEYKRIGINAAKGTAEGFINGAVSAAIVTSCRAGFLGSTLKTLDPTVVGMVTVVAIGAIKNSYKVVKGEMSRYAMSNYLVRDLFVGTCGLALGAATQYFIRIPILGYMIGSFVGSAIGSFAYQAGYSATMSFCVDTGFTLFGLVDQNYRLPEDVLQEIGIEVFDYEKFDYVGFEHPEFEFDRFEPDCFEVDVVDITFIRRGVIGVSRIGYL